MAEAHILRGRCKEQKQPLRESVGATVKAHTSKRASWVGLDDGASLRRGLSLWKNFKVETLGNICSNLAPLDGEGEPAQAWHALLNSAAATHFSLLWLNGWLWPAIKGFRL